MNTHAQISTSAEGLMANAIRALTMDAVQAANSGHPGAPMGMAEVATVLFNRFIKIDPECPDWPDRDRFVMSAGHGSMLVYAMHHLLGYDDMGIDQIKNFRQMGARTAGHPEYGHAKGIETTTGPLGQGLTNAVGMALAERMMQARFGGDLVNHFTYVIAGDGCLMEGISHEAIDFAGTMRLGRLVLFWDDNNITIDGAVDLSSGTDQKQRFGAAGWHVQQVDGHDKSAIAAAIEAAQEDPRPSMIACKTIIGFGAPNKQGSAATHGAPLGAEEIAAARIKLNWPHEPFDIPPEVKSAWQAISKRGRMERGAWQNRLSSSPKTEDFATTMGPVNTQALDAALTAYKAQLSQDAPHVATRQASQMVLEVINETLPNTVGGSADLTGSNLTRTCKMQTVTAPDYRGDYIHYGIREHAMAAIMNGLCLHGGFKPYGGTFLAFADYCRPAIRLSALMQLPVIYVMSHDSIGLGEDGPTHQPVEHLASLRAMPNLNLFRPADAVETAEAWQVAITDRRTPSVLSLSRQSLPTLRRAHSDQNLTARGAYVLRDPARRQVTLIATGSEVALALEAADQLAADGVQAAVVSAPCFELFAQQDIDYQLSVLGTGPRVGVEAAVQMGWNDLLGHDSAFIGMSSFGASAPADELYSHFGITAKAVAMAAHQLIRGESA